MSKSADADLEGGISTNGVGDEDRGSPSLGFVEHRSASARHLVRESGISRNPAKPVHQKHRRPTPIRREFDGILDTPRPASIWSSGQPLDTPWCEHDSVGTDVPRSVAPGWGVARRARAVSRTIPHENE